MNTRLRMEEYYPASGFLQASFDRDRAELVGRFSVFTPVYQTKFNDKKLEVQLLEQGVVLTDDQKNATADLYAAAGTLNNELNFLVFYFKQAGLDNSMITKVKKDLNRDNIEGACLKLEGLIQFIIDKQALLVSKGMAATFPTELAATRDLLVAKNELQNLKQNQLKQLHSDNNVVYKELYKYITTICGAGKIMYKGQVKVDEYTIAKLIRRMRSANEGGDVRPPIV